MIFHNLYLINLARTTNGSPQIQAAAVGNYNNPTDSALVGLHGSSISDLSQINGQMLYSSSAISNGYSVPDFKNQVINEYYEIDKPQDGSVIRIPIDNLKDVVATRTSNSGVDYQAIYNPSVTYLTANNFSDKNISVIGKDGNPSQSQATTNPTNGIAYLEYKYDGGDIPSTLSFNFVSTLGNSTLTNLFTGTYNVHLSIKPATQKSSSADNQSQSSASSSTTSSAQDSNDSSDKTSLQALPKVQVLLLKKLTHQAKSKVQALLVKKIILQVKLKVQVFLRKTLTQLVQVKASPLLTNQRLHQVQQ